MTTHDYKALCAELADAIETWCDTWHSLAYTDPRISLRLIADRARVALVAEAVGPPTDAELLAMAADALGYEWISNTDLDGVDGAVEAYGTELVSFARAVLARYSAPRPIPVAERLPGAGDCDAEGRCWWGDWGEEDCFTWELRNESPTVAPALWSHWLPAHALPTPAQEGADE